MRKISIIYKKLKLHTKVVALISVAITLILASIVFVNAYFNRKNTLDVSKEYVKAKASEYASKVQLNLSSAYETCRVLNINLLNLKHNTNPNRSIISEIFKQTLAKNPFLLSLWTMWEPNAYDGQDSLYVKTLVGDEFGRFQSGVYRIGNEIKEQVSYDNPDSSDFYYIPKRTKSDFILDPYSYSYEEDVNNEIFMTSLVMPIIEKNAFIGVVGVDVSMDFFYNYCKDKTVFESGYSQIVTNVGIIASHPNNSFEGMQIQDFPQESVDTIIRNFKSNKIFEFEGYSSANEKRVYSIFVPLRFGDSNNTWYYILTCPTEEMNNKANSFVWVSILISFIGLILMIIAVYWVSIRITKPILNTSSVLKLISTGKIDKNSELYYDSEDEIGEMTHALNSLIENLNETAVFAKEIGKGNYDVQFKPLSDDDILGNSLIEMRNNLLHAYQEEEKRKLEDEKRNWHTQGMAKFGDILRKSNDNIKDLGHNITINIVNYLKINQCGVFVLNDEDKNNTYLELAACFAYDRQKFLKSKILIGEGLIGACYKERKTVYLTDIPQSYMSITSGLGKENSKSILIVPLKLNDEVFGVLELASFKEFEKYEIEFVEKLSESIASTISSVRINERTAKLLEQSQLQSEQMRAQEEEMRQNMEEMHATQEEMQRKNIEADNVHDELKTTIKQMQSLQDEIENEKAELNAILSALDNSFMRVLYSKDKTILDINDNVCKIGNFEKSDLIGQTAYLFVKDQNRQNFDIIWENVIKGNSYSGEDERVTNAGNKLISYTYTPIYNKNGIVVKVLWVGSEVKESKIKK